MGLADVYRQTDSFRRMRHHFGRKDVLHAWVEGLFLDLNFRVEIWYCTVQAESWVALVRPCNAEEANCHSLWPTLFGLCDVTVKLGVDVLLDESRHCVWVIFG